MVEHEHRARDGTLVEPGELSAKERMHARGPIPRGAPTLPIPVVRPDDAAAASLTHPDAAPGSAESVAESDARHGDASHPS
jgi:hypothetical protein